MSSTFNYDDDSGSGTDYEFNSRVQDRIQHTLDRRSSGRSSSGTARNEQRQQVEQQHEMQQNFDEGGQRQQQSVVELEHSILRSDLLPDDSFEDQCLQRLKANPKPYDANKIRNLVHTLLREQFASQSRAPSSRGIEQQRAGSSVNAIFTPLLNNIDPELILRDESPKNMLPPTTSSHKTHSSAHDQQRQQSQTQIRSEERQRQFATAGTQTSTSQLIQPAPAPQQPEPASFTSSSERANGNPAYRIDPTTNANRQREQQQQMHRTRRSPSPIQRGNFQQQFDWQSQMPKRKTISDYPPIYDFNRPPTSVPPPQTNIERWSLDAQHHRNIYLDSMMKGIRSDQLAISKFKAKTARFAKQYEQELDEWELNCREHELEMRKKLLEEKYKQTDELQKELGRRQSQILADSAKASQSDISTQKLRQPPPPILKNRVTFNSPICSFKEHTRERNNTSTFTDDQMESPRQDVENLPRKEVENLPRKDVENQQSDGTHDGNPPAPDNHFHHRQSHRNALANSTNQQKKAFRHSTSLCDVQVERDKEGNRMDYLNKWRRNQEALKSAKHKNPRIILRSNPTSIFQPISHHSQNFPSTAKINTSLPFLK